jgi:DNA polymerase sigma
MKNSRNKEKPTSPRETNAKNKHISNLEKISENHPLQNQNKNKIPNNLFPSEINLIMMLITPNPLKIHIKITKMILKMNAKGI